MIKAFEVALKESNNQLLTKQQSNIPTRVKGQKHESE